ncbi:hypothetical protein V7S57_02255 [Caulobacter sp. CCNWLY153]|uniref:hypothetical protein n=1 Tax=unclassified Caulobacter TaxID=2648921 RepID=UPI002FF05342
MNSPDATALAVAARALINAVDAFFISPHDAAAEAAEDVMIDALGDARRQVAAFERADLPTPSPAQS